MYRLGISDLDLKTLVKRRMQLLTTAQWQKRLVRTQLILNKLKEGCKDKALIFSDE